MQSRSRVPQEPHGRFPASATIAERRDAELAAIALLCLIEEMLGPNAKFAGLSAFHPDQGEASA